MSNISSAFLKNFKAETAVPRHRICKFGASDTAVVLATAAADLSFGVSAEIDAAIGEPCDVAIMGLVPVTYGGVVARGNLLTSDALGRAVAAAPGAGVSVEVIGRAMIAGVLGDIGSVNLSPSRVRG
jgi:hypothetical protein